MRLDICSCQDKQEAFHDFTLALSFQVLLRTIENDCHAEKKSQRLSDFRLRKTFIKDLKVK